MWRDYLVTICLFGIAIALVAFVIYLLIAYATIPVSELPTWVAWIFFGRN